MARSLEREEGLDSFCVDELTIKTKRKVQTVALDGEMFRLSSPLKVVSRPEVLQLIIPPPEPVPEQEKA
jgi:hypothetical protein